ncbi:hypothetical protein [Deinococcus humi]|uniref:Uncharacterized protein n=1 Tax=Deinococcus humi TaxID=662880 RepID=A0A7W8JUA2_9DEIO|nr:hypothetical protein [Deinococcus humi]MBB5363070.1 hypothetical protein [Deinococcus humi]GGO24869.1 hypothetical protein GCM10008949_14160 [Deinococcus humi]
MTKPIRPTLPTLALDYDAGILTNTMTGEYGEAVYGVVLAFREDRALWPTIGELPRLPICVNGSEFGPCLCAFADWGKDGTPPDCTEELTLLLWMDDGAQVMTLTARRSQVKTLTRYLDTKAMLGGILHDQYVTIRMTPEGAGHRLTLLPGELVDREAQARLAGVAERAVASGAFGALS